MFDIFTKIFIAGTFLLLTLTFLDLVADVGFGYSEEDLFTAGGLAAFAVFFNLLGNALYRLIERYGPQPHRNEIDQSSNS
jgi:hypothetical protein